MARSLFGDFGTDGKRYECVWWTVAHCISVWPSIIASSSDTCRLFGRFRGLKIQSKMMHNKTHIFWQRSTQLPWTKHRWKNKCESSKSTETKAWWNPYYVGRTECSRQASIIVPRTTQDNAIKIEMIVGFLIRTWRLFWMEWTLWKKGSKTDNESAIEHTRNIPGG